MEGGEVLGKLMVTCRIQRRNIKWWLERKNSPNSEESKALLGIIYPPCKAPSFLPRTCKLWHWWEHFLLLSSKVAAAPQPAGVEGAVAMLCYHCVAGHSVWLLSRVTGPTPGTVTTPFLSHATPGCITPLSFTSPCSTQALPWTSKVGSLILDEKGQSCLWSTFSSDIFQWCLEDNLEKQVFCQ